MGASGLSGVLWRPHTPLHIIIPIALHGLLRFLNLGLTSGNNFKEVRVLALGPQHPRFASHTRPQRGGRITGSARLRFGLAGVSGLP